jgi:hypothetical protein
MSPMTLTVLVRSLGLSCPHWISKAGRPTADFHVEPAVLGLVDSTGGYVPEVAPRDVRAAPVYRWPTAGCDHLDGLSPMFIS